MVEVVEEYLDPDACWTDGTALASQTHSVTSVTSVVLVTLRSPLLSSFRMCRQIQVLRRPHHSRLGEALVVPEEDLLSHC